MDWTRIVYIIGCSKEKQTGPTQARYMYQGRLFKAAFSYAEHHGTETLILSAKYGLIRPDKMIEPYDVTFLPSSSSAEVVNGETLYMQAGKLNLIEIPETTRIFLIAGKEYYERLAAARIKAQPLYYGLPIGQVYSHLTNDVIRIRENAWKRLGCPAVLPSCPRELKKLADEHVYVRAREREVKNDAIRGSRGRPEVDLHGT